MNNINSAIFEAIFNSSTEGFIILGSNGCIKLTNPILNEMFGYNTEELIGERIEILVPKNKRKTHQTHQQKFSEKPEKRAMGGNTNLEAQAKDGKTFSVEISLNHIESDGEKCVIAMVTDISKRVEAQLALKKANEELEIRVIERTEELIKNQKLYQLVARKFPNGTINVFDKDLKYIFVEGQELRKYRIKQKHLIGTKYIDRLPKELAHEIEHNLNEVFKGKEQYFEVEYQKNTYVLNAVPLVVKKGAIEQILVIEKNITKKKIAENQLKKMLEKEKQLNELKSRFVSMASHEFRTPLTTILSSASLAKKYIEKEQQNKREKHFTRIKTAVHSLTSILNDFLSIEKLESGNVSLNNSDFNIIELFEESIDEIDVTLKQGQEIVFTKNKIKTEEINTDRNVLKNILINLLSNASKYSDIEQKIRVSLKEKIKYFEIEVKDSGIGIPEEDQPRLFQRFYRAKNVTNIQGTGLGLNLVKKYVEVLHGTISYTSKEDVGSTFTIKIPIQNQTYT